MERHAWASLLDIGVEGLMDPLLPVDNLDQLYCQAVALNPILISKVQMWAAKSRGYFCTAASGVMDGNIACNNEKEGPDANSDGVTISQRDCLPPGSSGFVLWADMLEQGLHIGGQVSWAKVKSVKRSIEKSTRSYGKVAHFLTELSCIFILSACPVVWVLFTSWVFPSELQYWIDTPPQWLH